MTDARSTQDSPCPKKLGEEVDHYWLVQRMAKTADVDLAAAFADGALTPEEWAGMVTTCRACAWADGCKEWLDVPGQTVDTPPEDCLNRARMATLKRVAEAQEGNSAA